MSNQIYFCGYRAEHFTGLDGESVPNILTNISGTGWNSIHLNEQNQLYPLVWGSAYPGPLCAFMNTTGNNFQDLYISFEVGSYNATAAGAQPSCYYFRDSNNHGFRINFNFYKTVSPYYGDIVIYYGSYDSSGNFTVSSSVSLSSYKYLNDGTETYYYCRMTIKLSSSSGTSYDKIDIFTNRSLVNYSTDSLYSGSLPTSLSDINLYYSKYDTSVSDYVGAIFYLIVSNFNLTGSYLDYSMYSNKGTTSQWDGDVSTFSTYPVNYSSTGGMIGTTNNTSQSYTLSKVLNYDNTAITAPICMINSSNNISTSTRSDVITYTNGYTGTCDISIPNYLEPGTGIELISYVSSTLSSIYFILNAFNGYPNIILNMDVNANLSIGSVALQNTSSIAINNSIIFNSWNKFIIFNNSGTLEFYVNNNKVSESMLSVSEKLRLNFNNSVIIASLAYIKSSSVSYPFDKDSNVTSYIDFADPNNLIVYGDTTQLSVVSKTLTASTAISNVPDIEITSNTYVNISPYVINGSNFITSTDTSSVSSSGSTSTFYMYDNPITNKPWTSDDIKNSQFGLTKLS